MKILPCKLLCLAALCAVAASAVAQGTHKLPEIKYEKYTLPNGLTVITHEDHKLPLVAVDLWYHVGPSERAARTHRLCAPVRAHDV